MEWYSWTWWWRHQGGWDWFLPLFSYRGLRWLLFWFRELMDDAGRELEGSRWLTVTKVNTYGEKTGEICRVSAEAMPAIGFIGDEISWVCLLNWSLWTAIKCVAWLLFTAPAFLPFSWPSMYVSTLPIWVGWIQSRTLGHTLKCWKNSLFTPPNTVGLKSVSKSKAFAFGGQFQLISHAFSFSFFPLMGHISCFFSYLVVFVDWILLPRIFLFICFAL